MEVENARLKVENNWLVPSDYNCESDTENFPAAVVIVWKDVGLHEPGPMSTADAPYPRPMSK